MDVLSLPQAAEVLGISRQRVYQLVIARTLKTIEVLGRRAVTTKELERFRKLDRPAHRPRAESEHGLNDKLTDSESPVI